MKNDAIENEARSSLSADVREVLAKLEKDTNYLTHLLKVLKGIAKFHLKKGGLGRVDAGDLASDAIIAIFNGKWTWDPKDGKTTDLGMPTWTPEMHSLCYRCCAIIRSKASKEYRKSSFQESGSDDQFADGFSSDSDKTSTDAGNPWRNAPIAVLICQENWDDVQAVLPKTDTTKNLLLVKIAEKIAHSCPVRVLVPTFTTEEILNPTAFVIELRSPASNLSKFLWAQFATETRLLTDFTPPINLPVLTQALANELNKIINDPLLNIHEHLRGVKLSTYAKSMLDINPKTDERMCFHRLLLECAFPEYVSRRLHYAFEEGLARRKPSWANRELAAVLGVSEREIVNGKRQLETILAPWVWARFKEFLPNDRHPWADFIDEAERPNLSVDWKSTFAKKHSLTLTEVVEMGQKVPGLFQEWWRILHRTVKSKAQADSLGTQIAKSDVTAPADGDRVPLGRVLDKRLNRIKQNI